MTIEPVWETEATTRMRILRVEIQRVEDVPLTRPLALGWDPGVVRSHDSFTVVRVHSDTGLTGVGTVSRSKPARLAAAALIGRDVGATGQNAQILRETGGAYGLDIALWDLLAQDAGVPLAGLWGAAVDRVPAYVSTVEVGAPEQRAEDALGFLAEGFRGLKLRLHHATLAEDLALAHAVREAVGEDMVLMADANQARAAARDTVVRWDFERALATARALEELDFAWLEEPLPADALPDLARLRDDVGIDIAGGERDQTLARFTEVIASEAYDIVQPDGVTGESLGELRRIGALAHAHGQRCIPHHGGGGIGTYAHLHLTAALPDARWLEVIRDRPGEIPWPAQQVPTVPIRVAADGAVAVPTGPGLGIELDEERIAGYTASRIVID